MDKFLMSWICFENKEKEAFFAWCAVVALFIERYKQIDDDFLKKSFISLFSILDDIYPWV